LFFSMAAEHPGHFFWTLAIFQCWELLVQLKALITKEKLQHISRPTGIPPHVKQAAQLKEWTVICTDTLTAVGNQTSILAMTVWTAIDNKDEDNRHITGGGGRLRSLFNSFKTTIMRDILSCFASHNDGAAQELVPRHDQQGGKETSINQLLPTMEDFGKFHRASSFLVGLTLTLGGNCSCLDRISATRKQHWGSNHFAN
jgi:hypothetical protein